jgi:hypothetical protein
VTDGFLSFELERLKFSEIFSIGWFQACEIRKQIIKSLYLFSLLAGYKHLRGCENWQIDSRLKTRTKRPTTNFGGKRSQIRSIQWLGENRFERKDGRPIEEQA